MKHVFRTLFATVHEKLGLGVLADMAYEAGLDWFDCPACQMETPHDNGKCRYCGEGT